MLMAASDAPDPAQFRETELFRRCQDMGIIPRTEAELAEREKAGEPARQAGEMPASPETTGSDDGDHRLSLNLKVDGMWCPACAWVIDETLKKTPGVLNAATAFATDQIRCTYDPVRTAPSQIIRRIERLGYSAALFGEAEAGPRRREFIRFCVAAFITMNVMMLSFALYSGFFITFDMDTIYKLSWPIFGFATIVFFYGGYPLHRRALAGFLSAAFGMETLISAAAASAYFYSIFNLAYGSLHLYFDTASMLITLTLLGKILERRAKDRVLEDLDSFFSLRPTRVKLCTEAAPGGRYVAAEILQPGDRFVVDPAEVIPADGIIREGNGAVDESSLTGEAVPIGKKTGDRVRSGTIVTRGSFTVEAEAVGEASTLGQMLRIMERTLGKKTAFEGKTDRILQAFVPVILMLAAGTGAVGYMLGLSAESAMIRAITVMVISCPCALGIAIPLARVAGLSLAGRDGILVREFSGFEQANGVDVWVFDKTGTLTEGRFDLRRLISLPGVSEETMLGLAAALEKEADHHIAAEIRRVAETRGIAPAAVTDITVFSNGVSGIVPPDSQEVRIGSREFLADALQRISPSDMADLTDLFDHSDEFSRVYMSVGGRLAAIFVFGDAVREESPEMIRTLQEEGSAVAMISGDEEKTVAAVARRAGVTQWHGGLLPEEKARFVEALQREGKTVAMAGDGINDAPALVQADLSVAIHSGAHLGREAADITLMRGDLKQLLRFRTLARHVNRKVHQNLVCSLIYNLLAIPVAMSGLLTPVIAVIAMLLSSLSVIGNTLLLIRKPL